MTTDNKTLADVQPGGRVRLGDQLVLAKLVGAAGLMLAEIDTCGHEIDPAYRHTLYEAWEEGKAALSAQPSPGGQDALAALQQDYDKLLDSFNRQVEVAEKIAGRALQQDDRIEELEEALAARQPVGQITDAEIDARLNALYREMVDSGQHNGGMSGVAWDRAVFRMASKQPAQAVDLGPVHAALQAAARSLRTIADSTKDTEFLETASEIRAYANSRANCAEQALIDSQAVGNG
jgi:hypothetical protein